MSDSGFCELCGEMLDLVEMLDMTLDEVDSPSLCDHCIEIEFAETRNSYRNGDYDETD